MSELSEFEQRVLKNKKEADAFLKSLGINQIKEEFKLAAKPKLNKPRLPFVRRDYSKLYEKKVLEKRSCRKNLLLEESFLMKKAMAIASGSIEIPSNKYPNKRVSSRLEIKKIEYENKLMALKEIENAKQMEINRKKNSRNGKEVSNLLKLCSELTVPLCDIMTCDFHKNFTSKYLSHRESIKGSSTKENINVVNKENIFNTIEKVPNPVELHSMLTVPVCDILSCTFHKSITSKYLSHRDFIKQSSPKKTINVEDKENEFNEVSEELFPNSVTVQFSLEVEMNEYLGEKSILEESKSLVDKKLEVSEELMLITEEKKGLATEIEGNAYLTHFQDQMVIKMKENEENEEQNSILKDQNSIDSPVQDMIIEEDKSSEEEMNEDLCEKSILIEYIKVGEDKKQNCSEQVLVLTEEKMEFATEIETNASLIHFQEKGIIKMIEKENHDEQNTVLKNQNVIDYPVIKVQHMTIEEDATDNSSAISLNTININSGES